jgi:hypothetical protein
MHLRTVTVSQQGARPGNPAQALYHLRLQAAPDACLKRLIAYVVVDAAGQLACMTSLSGIGGISMHASC